MPHIDRTNALYDKAGWNLRKGRLLIAFALVGAMTGCGFGIVLGVILILIGLPNWIFIPSIVVAGAGGVYVGFARWHARYGGRLAPVDH